MIASFFFLSIIAALGSADAEINLGKRGLCPMHYVTGPHDLCFRFAEDKKDFNQARMQCESEGGTLANTQSPEAYTFARHHIESNPVKANIAYGIFGEVTLFTPWANGWYVGASKHGNWRWLNGQAVLDHWLKGTPNNWGGHENCLQQMAGAQGWNDVPCDMKIRYICQKAMNNPCTKFHCGNGRCVVDHDKPICVCSAGWTGANCGQKIIQDVCAVSRLPCKNGHCIADSRSGGRPVCICNAGWTGVMCQTRATVDHCKPANPCQNGGECFSNNGGYSCRCIGNFKGTNCDTPTAVNHCATNPCRNGGRCLSDSTGYICHCIGNFKGTNCESSCRFKVTNSGMPEKVDAVVLIDGSNSVNAVNPGNFRKSLQFIINLADKLDIGAGKARLEITQFSHKLAEAVNFDDSVQMSKDALKAKIANIDFLGGGTATDKALNDAYRVFKTQGRHESDVAKYLVVMTDGVSNRGDQIRNIVSKLKALGVKIVAVGVGGSVDPAELRLIGGGSVYTVGSFDQLNNSLISKMVQNVCD